MYHFGNTLNGDNANCDGSRPFGTQERGKNLQKTTNVKSYQPNAWGLYDMHGNVHEWCLDTEKSGDNTYVRFRGGSYLAPAQECITTVRGSSFNTKPYKNVGFRLALVRTDDGEETIVATGLQNNKI